MRERPDGKLEAENFEEHMMPGVQWEDDAEFEKAFDALLEQQKARRKLHRQAGTDPMHTLPHDHMQPREEELKRGDPLAAARGISRGTILALVIWAGIVVGALLIH